MDAHYVRCLQQFIQLHVCHAILFFGFGRCLGSAIIQKIGAKGLRQFRHSFADVAKTNDPITGGDLDWVARGILVYPQLEEALFALQPGSYSDIIETDIGFHILYAAERSTDHALTPQSRQILEHKILSD